ncbi:uncharacterized protein LOC121718836 isoform X3 [Alosa sapidissima]|uniref:uncharacterized protein LOC121718836 isoform X3 n=1 Tax=Alosa sapidissima TaxID=34773 RepID=UPI001C09A233|nr:uncharacterized protein LOC121718836 isoform X3 [Alosa sapidissima]
MAILQHEMTILQYPHQPKLLRLQSPQQQPGLLYIPSQYSAQRYPSHKMYSDVLGALITRYPFLRDGSLSGFETLLECLKNKFKKERRTLVHMDKVLEMKQKYGQKHPSTTTGLTRPSPNRKRQLSTEPVEAEDTQSIAEHLKAITEELHKSRPNFENIKWRMERTLHARTPLYKISTAAELFQQCPFLKVPCLLLYEMKLRFGQDLDLVLSSYLHNAAEKIVETCKGPLKNSFTATMLQAHPLQSKCMLNNAAVMLLPTLMKENHKLLYCINEEPPAPTPTMMIRCENSPLAEVMVSIKIDGEFVIGPSPDIDASLGLVCIFCLYFLFDVQYPKEVHHTLLFFERRLNLSMSKPSTPVLRVEKMLS